MQLSKTLLLLVALLSAGSVFAQEKINILKAGGNLLGIFYEGNTESYAGAGLSLEHQLRKKTTLGINVDYNGKKTEVSDGTVSLTARLTTITIEPEFRFYPQSATRGFYIGFAPAALVSKIKYTGLIQADVSDTSFAVSLKTGYQFPLSSFLHLQIGGGIGAILPSNDSDLVGRYTLNLLLGFQL